MDDSVRTFYDRLADDYHLLFADWPASMVRQAAALDRLIASELGSGPHNVRDCACGIGTQAIGLALLGHRVRATDLSPAAVERAEREAAALGARLSFGVADLQRPATEDAGRFDVVLAWDNALPHLPSNVDLRRAVTGMTDALRPGGLFLVSIRDYDRLAEERPGAEGPRVLDGAEGRRIAFQVWDWTDDGRTYRLHQFLVRQDGGAWRTDHFEAEYRALGRDELEAALRSAGLVEVRWHQPEDAGFHQPAVTARRPRE